MPRSGSAFPENASIFCVSEHREHSFGQLPDQRYREDAEKENALQVGAPEPSDGPKHRCMGDVCRSLSFARVEYRRSEAGLPAAVVVRALTAPPPSPSPLHALAFQSREACIPCCAACAAVLHLPYLAATPAADLTLPPTSSSPSCRCCSTAGSPP